MTYVIGILAYCGLVSVACAVFVVAIALQAAAADRKRVNARGVPTFFGQDEEYDPREPRMVVADNGVAYLEAP